MAGGHTAARTAKPRRALRPPRRTLGVERERDGAKRKDADIRDLLRFALAGDGAQSDAARRGARAAALRLARDLQRHAAEVTGAQSAALEQQAREGFYRSVIARQLPNLAGALRRVGEETSEATPSDGRPRPLMLTLTPPTDVTATAGIASATVRWTPPAAIVASYRVIPHTGATAHPPTIVPGAAREATVLGLTPGTAYRFRVEAVDTLGGAQVSELSNEIVPLDLAGAGGSAQLRLLALSSDSVLPSDPAADAARKLLASATQTAAKWRYEHLREEAIEAAKETMAFEQQIASVMALALDKLSTSEELLGDTLIEATQLLQDVAQQLAEAASAPAVDDLVEGLGALSADALLLPRFLAWLIETGPLNFWVGLFEAIVNDLASVVPFFGGPTGFGRTERYLERAFSDDVDGVRVALQDAVRDILGRLDADVAQMVAPLRAAVAQVTGGTRKAMAEVFEASDVVLLMSPGRDPGTADVPDVDPFASLYQRLQAQVDQLAEQIKTRIRAALEPLLSGGSGLFKTLVITFLVIPLLAFLVIGLAGGPFSAALLAAIVLVAAQELLRLLVGWLTGPLLERVEDVKRQVAELVGGLRDFFDQQAGLVANKSPEKLLEILAAQLRQVTDFVPQAFLEDTAAVLEQARNVILRTATALALSAEQALGMENATAFDAIGLDYATNLAPAPQMPGGRDRARLAGAALLRDLGRLEQQRTAVRDGKELVFTHTISVLRALGGDTTRFQQFLQRRELVLELDERELLDRTFPGVYRALVDGVDVFGQFPATTAGPIRALPLTITHLGDSRTRIRRRANAAAPPLTLPDCFPRTREEFTAAVAGQDPVRAMLTRAFAPVQLHTFGEYALALLGLIIFGFPDPIETLTGGVKRVCREQLPDAFARAVEQAGCGLANRAVAAEQTLALLGRVRFATAIASVLLPPDALSRLDERPDKAELVRRLADLLRAGNVTATPPAPGLEAIAGELYDQAVKDFHPHIAKWGEATLEEDPDPQVRALGYATLVRRMAPETAVFNLESPTSPTTVRAQPMRPERAATEGPPSARDLQYRPFENRGLGGRLLLRLETVGDAGGAQAGDLLSDVVVQLQVRACFDQDLAQTVRSSRRQTASALSVADAVAGAISVPPPGTVSSLDAGAGELRTVHYSLRAHRDKTLQVWAAAAQAAPATVPGIVALLPGKTPLGRDAAFQPLQPGDAFALEFSSASPANTEAGLLGLASLLRVQPEDLGFSAAVLSGRSVVEEARLETVGLGVIPMHDAVRGPADLPTVDPLGVQLSVTGPLESLLPGFGSAGAPLPQRLRLSEEVAEPPTLAQVFSAATPPRIGFGFAEGLLADGKLYDVIVSLTFRVPVLHGSPVAASLL